MAEGLAVASAMLGEDTSSLVEGSRRAGDQSKISTNLRLVSLKSGDNNSNQVIIRCPKNRHHSGPELPRELSVLPEEHAPSWLRHCCVERLQLLENL